VLLSARKADASVSKQLGQSDTFKDYRSMQRNSAGRFQSSSALSAQNLSEKTDGRTLWASGRSPSTKE
jgi:hypothetical protein